MHNALRSRTWLLLWLLLWIAVVTLASGLPTAGSAEASESADAPSFRQDVMPVLFRAGCNAGTCHGSARGKDGFMLSLFGYDAKGDYERIVTEMPGRRVNTAVPEQSLLLLKAVEFSLKSLLGQQDIILNLFLLLKTPALKIKILLIDRKIDFCSISLDFQSSFMA